MNAGVMRFCGSRTSARTLSTSFGAYAASAPCLLLQVGERRRVEPDHVGLGALGAKLELDRRDELLARLTEVLDLDVRVFVFSNAWISGRICEFS